jgi:hypothetical protein
LKVQGISTTTTEVHVLAKSREKATSAFDAAVARMPTCALDEGGMAAQRRRYARLSADVESVEREPEATIVQFREDFDRGLLRETLAVERACCPFFAFDFDDHARRLRTTVNERDRLPALDAIAHALAVARETVTE